MKNILGVLFIVFIAISSPSCSRKSGCPADSAQSQVDKSGNYKTSKTKSGVLPPKGYHKKVKGKYKPKGKKEVHRN
ncbi:MAG TPA: hypothetical protein VMZ69_04500 [Saprospiraceae bacterium]|nr:hypothetical protein [Saprospiraceae bacterium]